MKPLVFVLLIVASVCAVPSVVVNQYTENELPPSSNVIENSLGFVDDGDTNISILNIREIIQDLSNQPDLTSQAIAIGQTLGVLTVLATGIPGDSCTSAALIDGYATAVKTGNFESVRQLLNNFIRQFANDLELIVNLVADPNLVKYAVGPREGCVGGGRSYQFEAAWEIILANVNKYTTSFLNEEYCSAKRLYYAFNSRSNNVGAIVTVLNLPPVVQIIEDVREPAAALLKALVSGRDPSAALARTRQLLLLGISRVKF